MVLLPRAIETGKKVREFLARVFGPAAGVFELALFLSLQFLKSACLFTGPCPIPPRPRAAPRARPGFLILSQCAERPARYGEPSRFETTPSHPSATACLKITAPSSRNVSLMAMPSWGSRSNPRSRRLRSSIDSSAARPRRSLRADRKRRGWRARCGRGHGSDCFLVLSELGDA